MRAAGERLAREPEPLASRGRILRDLADLSLWIGRYVGEAEVSDAHFRHRLSVKMDALGEPD